MRRIIINSVFAYRSRVLWTLQKLEVRLLKGTVARVYTVYKFIFDVLVSNQRSILFHIQDGRRELCRCDWVWTLRDVPLYTIVVEL